jgi:hypothetical protein
MKGATLEVIALELWRKREAGFPAFVRRMSPDALDKAIGAWHRSLAAAERKQQMDTARAVMEKRRNALRDLA